MREETSIPKKDLDENIEVAAIGILECWLKFSTTNPAEGVRKAHPSQLSAQGVHDETA